MFFSRGGCGGSSGAATFSLPNIRLRTAPLSYVGELLEAFVQYSDYREMFHAQNVKIALIPGKLGFINAFNVRFF